MGHWPSGGEANELHATEPDAGSSRRVRRPSRWRRALFALIGLSALVWFLVRVLPKPSRAAYPCQRVAMPLASSFVLWCLGLGGSLIAFRSARKRLLEARYAVAALCAAAGVSVACWCLSLPMRPAGAAWNPSDPPNAPMGVARGIHPGRVVWVHDPEATSWDGSSRYWWTDENTSQEVVDRMVSRTIRGLAGEADDARAWDAVFRHFNAARGRGDVGYRAGEGVAIKINMNVASDYALTNEPIASPQVVRALLRQLVGRAGVAESAISVYDASRCITDAIYVPCHAEFPQVTFVDGGGGAGRVRATPADGVPIRYADSRVGSSGTSRLPQNLVDATYLVNVALLRGHTRAGVTLCAKNYFGSIWRPGGGFSPSNVHVSVDRNANPMGSVNSLVDLMGHEHLGGKAVLFLIDGLYGANNQGSSVPHRWRMAPFEDDWTSSLFASQDGVAIDSVALDFCRSESTLENTVTGVSVDNYLHEAALSDAPPSGAVYDPEGDGTRLASLGVHEHWNDAESRQYSRNLGAAEGIELFVPAEPRQFRRGDANADGEVDVSDPVTTLLWLFGGLDPLSCMSAADADDSGDLTVGDAIRVLAYLFRGGEAPPAPFGSCGEDPTDGGLGCGAYRPCDPG